MASLHVVRVSGEVIWIHILRRRALVLFKTLFQIVALSVVALIPDVHFSHHSLFCIYLQSQSWWLVLTTRVLIS